MIGRLELTALGKLQIKRNGQPLTANLISAKGQALLIYLAITGQTYSRSALAGLLWGDMPEEKAKANLRLTLNKLRQSVGDYLTTTRQSVAFDFSQSYWSDVAEFESQALVPEQSDIEQLRAVVKLYQGDFLDDFYVQDAPDFETWVLVERERLRQLALKVWSHLATEARRRGDINEDIQVTRQILALESGHEEAHRQLIWLLAHSGQRSAALTQYEICRRALAEEVGVEPAPETTTLYEQIKAGILGQESDEFLTRLHSRSPFDTPFGRRASSAPLHNLPPQLTPFVGREAELAQIADLLANPDCRLLTLVGPGGIGKTRLALAAAEAQINAFRDGVRFVSLVGVAPARVNEAADLLIASIANAIHYTFSAQQPPRDLLLSYLADKEILLLLDNFERLRAAELLVDILQQAPRVKLLITSRERLSIGGEWVLDVEGLPYPPTMAQNPLSAYPAVQLFVQSARRIKPDFTLAAEETAVNRICQLVAGFPLGLELAANWVRALPCADVVTKLERNLDILATTALVVADRHQSMRAVLDDSWNWLNEAEQQVFRRLSVFQGGFELSAAEQVTGAALPVLAGLVDKSWLRRDDGGRYRVHELVRQYGAEQLATHPAEQTTTQQKHYRYYADFLETRRAPLEDSADKPSLAALDREVENIRAAWEWLLAQGELEAMAAYLEGLWRYYQHKGWFQEAVFVLSQVYAQEQASDLQKARWQRWLGEAYFQMGRLPESREHLEQAMALSYGPLPTTQTGWVLTLLRQILRQTSHRLWLTGFVGRSADRASLLEATRAMGQLGQLYFFAGEKLALLTAALYDLNLAEQAGSSTDLARGYSIVSLTLGSIPLHRLARLYSRLARETMPNVKRLSRKAYALEVTGVYKIGIGQWAEAQAALDQAADIFKRLELPRFWEESWSLLGVLSYHQGQFTQSAQHWADVFASAQRRGDPLAQFWSLLGQAECALRLGQIHADKVMFLLEKARALPDKYLGQTERIRLYGVLALAHGYQGHRPLAQQAAQTAAQFIKQSALTIVYSMEGYAGPAEVFLALWEAEMISDFRAPILDESKLKTENRESTPNRAVQNLKLDAQQGCRAFHAFARIYPIGQPRAWLYQGLYKWLAGQPNKAHQAWRKSLAAAERLAMPYEQGRAHYEIGRHLPNQQKRSGEWSRQDHLRRACDLLAELGAAYDLACAEAALAGERCNFC